MQFQIVRPGEGPRQCTDAELKSIVNGYEWREIQKLRTGEAGRSFPRGPNSHPWRDVLHVKRIS